jgi:hypothetical protein
LTIRTYDYTGLVKIVAHIETGELKKLDEKYLPDSVVEGIADAQTAAENARTVADDALTKADDALTKADDAPKFYNYISNSNAKLRQFVDVGAQKTVIEVGKYRPIETNFNFYNTVHATAPLGSRMYVSVELVHRDGEFCSVDTIVTKVGATRWIGQVMANIINQPKLYDIIVGPDRNNSYLTRIM